MDGPAITPRADAEAAAGANAFAAEVATGSKARKYRRPRKPRRRADTVQALVSARAQHQQASLRPPQDRMLMPRSLQPVWSRLEEKVLAAQRLVDTLSLTDFRPDYGASALTHIQLPDHLTGAAASVAAPVMARSITPLMTPSRPGSAAQMARPVGGKTGLPATSDAARCITQGANLKTNSTPMQHQPHQPPTQPRMHGSGAVTHRELRYAPVPIQQQVFQGPSVPAVTAGALTSPGWATARGPRPTQTTDACLIAASGASPYRPMLTARPHYRPSNANTPVRSAGVTQPPSRETSATSLPGSHVPGPTQWVAAPPGAPFSPSRAAMAQSGSPAAPRGPAPAAGGGPRGRPTSAATLSGATATGVMPPGGQAGGADGMAAKAAASMALRLPTDKVSRHVSGEEPLAAQRSTGGDGGGSSQPQGKPAVPPLALGGLKREGARVGPGVPSLRLGGIAR